MCSSLSWVLIAGVSFYEVPYYARFRTIHRLYIELPICYHAPHSRNEAAGPLFCFRGLMILQKKSAETKLHLVP